MYGVGVSNFVVAVVGNNSVGVVDSSVADSSPSLWDQQE